MPQISSTPQPAKRLIDASMPKNISAEEKENLLRSWNQKAFDRELAIARETRVPDEASVTLRYELKKFGKFWNAYHSVGRKWVPLMPTPSLLSSALSALEDKMTDEAMKS